jgi:hypothetical protein
MDMISKSAPKSSDSRKLRKALQQTTPTIKNLINAECGNFLNSHDELVKYIEKRARKGFHSHNKGIIVRDLECITDAWDEYVEESGIKGLDTVKKAKAAIPSRTGPKGNRAGVAKRLQQFRLRSQNSIHFASPLRGMEIRR